MTKNLIPIIAKELGVEIGEEFETRSIEGRFKLNLDGLEYKESRASTWMKASPLVLKLLVTGHCEIIKLPFEPKVGEIFWTYWINWSVTDFKWEDNKANFDFRKFCGCVFRTKEGALAARPVKFKEITGKDWEE